MPQYRAHPDDSANELAGKDVRVTITDDHKVVIGDVELPWIEKDGVTLEVGDDKNFNILQVRFLVGEVDVDESVSADLFVRGPATSLRGA